ncbi:hypothetical protein C8Q77DRAFT_82116 [Trametes polyzona]|nr:hypothetical protein C8Q77DRAFT_82116 [Trametes polyzona]
MLRRSARHAIAPTITLDFLIPRAALCGRTQAAVGSSGQPAHLGYRRLSSKLSPLPSASSSTPTPGTVLAHLERTIGPLDKQHLPSLTHTQVDAFNDAIPGLRTALAQRDLAKAKEIWTSLKQKSLMAFFGPAQYDVCARAVKDLLKHTSFSRLSEGDRQFLGDIAMACAVRRFTNGLRALMLAAVKDGNPEAALALFEQYVTELQERTIPRSDVAEGSSPLATDEFPAEDDESPTSPSPVRDDVLLAAVIAYAQLDNFAGALQVYLRTDTRIAQATLEATLRPSQLSHDLRTKVLLYARRLNAAALLSKPPTLMKHLSNLTRDLADKCLERLYATVIAGASGPDAWVATKPSQLSGTRAVLLPDFFWASFMKSFLACRRTDMAERLWDDMSKLAVKPDIAVWNAQLDGYGNLRSLDAVRTTWEVMVRQGVKPDALSHRALISAFFAVGKADEGLAHFHAFGQECAKKGARFEDSGVLAVYNTTLHGLLFADREEDALAIKRKMTDTGPKPDILTYNTFLRYYGRKGKLKTMASMLQELEPAGLKADVYTFSTLLAALLKVRPDADQIVVNFMKKQGVVPDTTSLTAIIDHQLRERTPHNFKVAMDLITKMERGDFGDAQPNAITYTSVLTAINRDRWLEPSVVDEYNKQIWEKMKSRHLQPNRATYNVLLKASLEGREPEGLENALRYYRDMVGQRVHVGTDTWYILLKGLLDRKRWDIAGEVVKDMRQHGVTNLSRSLRTLVEKVSRSNGMRAAGAGAGSDL